MADQTGPSETVLAEVASRSLKFFGAVSTNPYIRAALATRGYSQTIHDRAWALILQASGYRQPSAGAALATPEAAYAIAELDAWDEPNFRVARAALVGEFPDQCELVFESLEPQTGAAAVVSVSTFLDRLDTLEKGKDRKGTRKADQAALDKLSGRGITSKERARLRGLIDVAVGSSDDEPSPMSAKPDPKGESDRVAARLALYVLYSEWSEVAKADIKRRDHLIQLGIARRKIARSAKKTRKQGKEKAAEPKVDEPKAAEPKVGGGGT